MNTIGDAAKQAMMTPDGRAALTQGMHEAIDFLGRALRFPKENPSEARRACPEGECRDSFQK